MRVGGAVNLTSAWWRGCQLSLYLACNVPWQLRYPEIEASLILSAALRRSVIGINGGARWLLAWQGGYRPISRSHVPHGFSAQLV